MKQWWSGQDTDPRKKEAVPENTGQQEANDQAEAARQVELSRLNAAYIFPMLELLESFDNETLDLVAGYPNAGEDEYIENFSATDPDPAEEDLYAKELEILNTIQETLNSNDVDKAARVAALARDFTSLRK